MHVYELAIACAMLSMKKIVKGLVVTTREKSARITKR